VQSVTRCRLIALCDHIIATCEGDMEIDWNDQTDFHELEISLFQRRYYAETNFFLVPGQSFEMW
jgi:hypothetical protein